MKGKNKNGIYVVTSSYNKNKIYVCRFAMFTCLKLHCYTIGITSLYYLIISTIIVHGGTPRYSDGNISVDINFYEIVFATVQLYRFTYQYITKIPYLVDVFSQLREPEHATRSVLTVADENSKPESKLLVDLSRFTIVSFSRLCFSHNLFSIHICFT
jgi:hypothetical protein